MSKVENDIVSKLLTKKQSLEATFRVRLSETHGARIGVNGEFSCNLICTRKSKLFAKDFEKF